MPRREKIAFVGTGGTVSMTFNENQNGFIPTLSAGEVSFIFRSVVSIVV